DRLCGVHRYQQSASGISSSPMSPGEHGQHVASFLTTLFLPRRFPSGLAAVVVVPRAAWGPARTPECEQCSSGCKINRLLLVLSGYSMTSGVGKDRDRRDAQTRGEQAK